VAINLAAVNRTDEEGRDVILEYQQIEQTKRGEM